MNFDGQSSDTSQVDSNETELNEVDEVEYEDVSSSDESEGDEQSEDQVTAAEDDSEEIEFNQKQYKLPKDIAGAVRDMQKDYTVKTQSLADQRRTFEQQSQFQQQHIQEYAKVVALNDSIAEFDKIDWHALSQEDPVRAQQLFFTKSSLESQRNTLAQTISQKNQQVALEKQQEFAKQLEESESVLRRDIKDWSPDLESKLMTFASSNYGIDKNDFTNSKVNPMTMKLLHDAYIGKQIIQKQTGKPAVTTKKAEPVPILSGRGSKTQVSPDKMTDEQYDKWRKSGRK